MKHNVLLRPVVALMRRLPLRSKLALVALAALWPLPVLWLHPAWSLVVAPVDGFTASQLPPEAVAGVTV